MLQDYQPSLLDEMDHHDIDRQCWQCAHYSTSNGHAGHCTSLGMAQCCRDLTGISFGEDIKLPVKEDTDASLCAEFLLSTNALVLEEIADMLDDARTQEQRHMGHCKHLRRTAHA